MVVAELLGDGKLQLVTVDPSGNVACHDREGRLVWEAEVSGPVISGMRLSDVNGDGRVDIVITTQEG